MLEYQKSSAAKASHCAGRVVGKPKTSEKSDTTEKWGSGFYLCEFAFSTVRAPMSRGVSGRGDPRFLVPQYEGVTPAAYPAWRTKKRRIKALRFQTAGKEFKAHQMAINLVPA